MLDAPRHRSDPHGFTNRELIFDDDKKTVDEIADQMLRAEAHRQTCEPSRRRDGRNVKAEFRQRGKERADDDDGGSGAVQKAGHGLYVLLANTCDSSAALRPRERNQPARQNTQETIEAVSYTHLRAHETGRNLV